MNEDEGGRWHQLDPVSCGRVQILQVAGAYEQAAATVAEIHRLKELDTNFEWRDCALLGRTRDDLMPVRAAFETCGISRDIVSRRYDLLTLEDVYLDFAGRQMKESKIHQHLGRLTPGVLLKAVVRSGGIELQDEAGVSVARFSARGRDVWTGRLNRIRAIRLMAMIQRTKDAVASGYADSYPTVAWEVPVVEIQWNGGND